MASNPDIAGVELHAGECLAWLRTLPDQSVHAVVTDPPYGLRFMGKRWDYDVPPIEVWIECLRVLVPGGYLVSFGGSRTSHRIATAIEDAGFELRDTLLWLYGSGMPKGRDIGKAIDKRRDDESAVREVCRFLRAAIDAHPVHTIRTLAEAFGMHPRMIEHWAARDSDSQPNAPTVAQWERLRELLDFGDAMDSAVARLNDRKGTYGEAYQDRPVTGTVEPWRDRVNYALTSIDGLRRDEPITEEARQWAGWNTALKPAYEPIILARKPFRGSVERNVLAYGTGAINVGGTRVGHASDADREESERKNQHTRYKHPGSNRDSYSGSMPARTDYSGADGRWPANVLLDPEAAEALDRQSGERGVSDGVRGASSHIYGGGKGFTKATGEIVGYGDTGGASRFFPTLSIEAPDLDRFLYMPKASRSERDAGCEELAKRPLYWSSGTQSPGTFQSAGTEREARNNHPTVKPIAVMRWLVRLVTPPGGIVCDPYTGSGTTGVAAILEHMRFIGAERDPEHVEISLLRMRYWAAELAAGNVSGELTVKRAGGKRTVRPAIKRNVQPHNATDLSFRQGPGYDDRPARPTRPHGLVQASFIGEEGDHGNG